VSRVIALIIVREAVVTYKKQFLAGRGIRKTTKYLSELPFYRRRYEGVLNYEMEVTVTNIKCTEHMEENRFNVHGTVHR
jgi:hypothetical protein